MAFEISYREFPHENSLSYADHEIKFNTAEEMLRFYDRIDWGSYLYCLHYITHNNKYVWFHKQARYSHEESINIDKIEEYRTINKG